MASIFWKTFTVYLFELDSEELLSSIQLYRAPWRNFNYCNWYYQKVYSRSGAIPKKSLFKVFRMTIIWFVGYLTISFILSYVHFYICGKGKTARKRWRIQFLVHSKKFCTWTYTFSMLKLKLVLFSFKNISF